MAIAEKIPIYPSLEGINIAMITEPPFPSIKSSNTCIIEYVNEAKNPHFIPYIYDITTMGSILAIVNPPPNGRLRNGMIAQTMASTVAIASITAVTVSLWIL